MRSTVGQSISVDIAKIEVECVTLLQFNFWTGFLEFCGKKLSEAVYLKSFHCFYYTIHSFLRTTRYVECTKWYDLWGKNPQF